MAVPPQAVRVTRFLPWGRWTISTSNWAFRATVPMLEEMLGHMAALPSRKKASAFLPLDGPPGGVHAGAVHLVGDPGQGFHGGGLVDGTAVRSLLRTSASFCHSTV